MSRLYTIAKRESRTYGHGDFGEELVIEKLGGYGTGDFPPLFTTELGAENWIASQQFRYGMEVVHMELSE